MANREKLDVVKSTRENLAKAPAAAGNGRLAAPRLPGLAGNVGPGGALADKVKARLSNDRAAQGSMIVERENETCAA